jgi:hypothetical protein
MRCVQIGDVSRRVGPTPYSFTPGHVEIIVPNHLRSRHGLKLLRLACMYMSAFAHDLIAIVVHTARAILQRKKISRKYADPGTGRDPGLMRSC